jgi:hypothetical protein
MTALDPTPLPEPEEGDEEPDEEPDGEPGPAEHETIEIIKEIKTGMQV